MAVGDVVREGRKEGWEAGLKQTTRRNPLCKTGTADHTALFYWPISIRESCFILHL